MLDSCIGFTWLFRKPKYNTKNLEVEKQLFGKKNLERINCLKKLIDEHGDKDKQYSTQIENLESLSEMILDTEEYAKTMECLKDGVGVLHKQMEMFSVEKAHDLLDHLRDVSTDAVALKETNIKLNENNVESIPTCKKSSKTIVSNETEKNKNEEQQQQQQQQQQQLINGDNDNVVVIVKKVLNENVDVDVEKEDVDDK